VDCGTCLLHVGDLLGVWDSRMVDGYSIRLLEGSASCHSPPERRQVLGDTHLRSHHWPLLLCDNFSPPVETLQVHSLRAKIAVETGYLRVRDVLVVAAKQADGFTSSLEKGRIDCGFNIVRC
jgi:hypothetical protein